MSLPRKSIASALGALCLAVAAPALAQDTGSFPSTFKKVVDNCDKGLEITTATLTIAKTDRNVTVAIDTLPTLKGKAGKGGKLRAEARGTANGLDVRYGLNGRVSDGDLQAVFVAEYFSGKRPVCTQSFRVVGSATKAQSASERTIAPAPGWIPTFFGF